MRQLRFFLIGGLAIAFTACNESGMDELDTPDVDLATEEAAESAFEDSDVITDAALDASISSGGRAESDEILECATITHDTVTQVITVDYGDGCEGRRGRTRSGKIIITYDGDRFTEGSFRTITFEDFFVDGAQIEGTRTHTVTTVDRENGIYTQDITLTGGKVTFEDGSFITREATKTRTWYRGLGIENYSTISAAASGLTREGAAYSMETTEDLVFKRACWLEGIFVPVAGVKVRMVGDIVVTVDYGDGECDRMATVTYSDGTMEEIELEVRGRVRG